MRARVVVLVLLVAVAVTACGDDGPRRVMLVGDSVMNQVAPPLSRDLPDDDVRNESVYGSGLLTPDYLDWPPHLRRLLDRYQPDEVIFLFIGNRAPGTEVDDAFFRAWQEQAQRMTDLAEDAGAEVTWVLPPPMADAEDQAVVDGLRDGYEQLGTATVDADDVLADGEGRDPDGVHLDAEGARRLARLIADQQ